VLVVVQVQAVRGAARASHFRILAAVRRVHVGAALSPEDELLILSADVHPVRGGLTNALYRYRLANQEYALKLYRVDRHVGDVREWRALRLLDRHDPGSVPAPVLRD
jgi:hypothetical protein